MQIFGMDLLNTETKKAAMSELSNNVTQCNHARKQLNDGLLNLNDAREKLSFSLWKTERLINQIKNTPTHFDDKIRQLKINLDSYEALLKVAKSRLAKSKNKTTIFSSLGITKLDNSALMALTISIPTKYAVDSSELTEFRIADTPLVAMIGGPLLERIAKFTTPEVVELMLKGPIIESYQNKKIASEIYSFAQQVEVAIKRINLLNTEIIKQGAIMLRSNEDLENRIQQANRNWPDDFKAFNADQIKLAGTLVNDALSAELLLNARLNESGKFVDGDA